MKKIIVKVKNKVISRKKNRNKVNKNKNVTIRVIVIVVLTFYILFNFFYKDKFKNINSVNNISSQGIVNNMLNITSYEVIAEIEIIGNKTINKYLVNQKYTMPDLIVQEILEPENMEGVKITKTGDELKLENTKLNMVSIYENYNYISENILDLCEFIEKFKNQNKIEYIENDKYIILELEYLNQTLYIDKLTGYPHSMEIKDTNQNNKINILYIKVEFNINN